MISQQKSISLNFRRPVIFNSVLLVFCCLLLCLPQTAAADELDTANKIQGDYCTLYFIGDIDYGLLDKNISIRLIDIPKTERENLKEASTIPERIAHKVDIILLKSEQILDMYPADFHVNVIFYENTAMLDKAYEEIMGERMHLYSFYVYEDNTIYTTQKRINENVLAHELGHALVNHYFVVRPPATVRELLSQYIDYHLED